MTHPIITFHSHPAGPWLLPQRPRLQRHLWNRAGLSGALGTQSVTCCRGSVPSGGEGRAPRSACSWGLVHVERSGWARPAGWALRGMRGSVALVRNLRSTSAICTAWLPPPPPLDECTAGPEWQGPGAGQLCPRGLLQAAAPRRRPALLCCLPFAEALSQKYCAHCPDGQRESALVTGRAVAGLERGRRPWAPGPASLTVPVPRCRGPPSALAQRPTPAPAGQGWTSWVGSLAPVGPSQGSAAPGARRRPGFQVLWWPLWRPARVGCGC